MDQLRALVNQLSLAQRAWILAGALGSVVLLAVVVMVAGQPDYQPAFTNLTPANTGTVSEALRKANIPFEVADAGTTVLVPSGRLSDAKVAAESAGVTADNVQGNELLDKLSFGASDFQQQQTALRALEGELTRTIQSLDGVASARVIINPQQKGLFADQDQGATASIVLTMQGGRSADPALVSAIVSATAGAVPGLDPKDVTVVDAAGRVLAGSGTATATGSAMVQDQVERDAEAKVQALLDKAIGAGKTAVSVSADMDFAKLERQITTYTPVDTSNYTPVSVQRTVETYGGPDTTGTGGIPGSGSNVPGLPTYPIVVPVATASPAPSASPGASAAPSASPAAGSAYVKTSETVNFNLSQTVDRVSRDPGVINRLSVAVLVDATAAKAIPTDQLTALVAAAVGADTKRGDVVTVSSVDFAAAADATAAAAPADGDMVGTGLGYARSALGILVALALLFLVWRNLKGLRRRADEANLALLAAGGPAGAMGLGMPGALAAGGLGVGADGMAPGASGMELGGMPVSPELAARTQIQGRLRQVADERPDALVSLMNGWVLREERRR